jgi:hypothetical protein
VWAGFSPYRAPPPSRPRRPEPYVLAFLYVALLPLAFLNLLWWPHQVMDSYRKQVLKPVDSLVEITRQFQVLDDALPVWPLRLRRLQAVVAAAVLPVVIPFVTAVILRMLAP